MSAVNDTTTVVGDALVDFVSSRDHASFVEVQEFLGHFIDPRGDVAWVDTERNILFWGGMSQEMVDVLEVVKDRIKPVASSPLVYLIDGRIPNLEVAKRPPKGGYKDQRWLPVVFRTTERADRALSGGA